MKRTSIVLDEKLIDECMKATGIRKQRASINHALRELLRHEKQAGKLGLKGRIDWDGDLSGWRKAPGL